MTLNELDKYLNNKIQNNEDFIEFSFYELRIKNNLSKKETEYFIELSRIKLENNNYKTYGPGDSFIYNEETFQVRENQLLVAVKIKRSF